MAFVLSTTRLGSQSKLRHNYTRTSTVRHFYFNRVVKYYGIACHPSTLTCLLIQPNDRSYTLCGTKSSTTLTLIPHVPSITLSIVQVSASPLMISCNFLPPPTFFLPCFFHPPFLCTKAASLDDVRPSATLTHNSHYSIHPTSCHIMAEKHCCKSSL